MPQKSSINQLWTAIALLLIGLAARWPHLNQSLWYDEMTTLAQFVLQPWQKILAPHAGQYVPNNHILHTILAKLIYHFATKVPEESLLRLPALLAGLFVPLALAWPMRKTNPWFAGILAVITTLHPWLIDFSTEARGYSLLLLLGIVATNCLEFLSISYVICLTLAIYTVPLALLLIPAHAAVVWMLHRSQFKRWLKQIGIVLFLVTLLYAPAYRGLITYYQHPYATTLIYRQLLDELPRFALAGIQSHGAIFWATPVIAIVIGSALAWSRVALRPLLLSMGITTLLGILVPLLIPGATEVRFVPWILPWFCLAITAILCAAQNQWMFLNAVFGISMLIAFELLQDVRMLPNQPVREAMQLADQIAPPGADIMMLYLGARESIAVYGNPFPRHAFLAAPDINTMNAMQIKSLHDTGHLPWVIIFYEKLAFERNHTDPLARGLWTNLIRHYHLITEPPLAGRITPVAIYAPN